MTRFTTLLSSLAFAFSLLWTNEGRAAPAPQSKPGAIAWKFKKGERFFIQQTYTASTSKEGKQKPRVERSRFIFEVRVLDVRPDGGVELEYTSLYFDGMQLSKGETGKLMFRLRLSSHMEPESLEWLDASARMKDFLVRQGGMNPDMLDRVMQRQLTEFVNLYLPPGPVTDKSTWQRNLVVELRDCDQTAVVLSQFRVADKSNQANSALREIVWTTPPGPGLPRVEKFSGAALFDTELGRLIFLTMRSTVVYHDEKHLPNTSERSLIILISDQRPPLP